MESKINSIITTALFGLSVLWYNCASATDKTETLTGTITLGSTGYGIKLESGKIIGFMGRGGNKVFAACHNGDRCEITGVVVYNIKNPLFLTVRSVHKIDGPAKTMAGSTPAQTQPPTDKDTPVTAPTPSATNTTQQTPPPASAKNAAPSEASATDTDKSDNSSPFLLDSKTPAHTPSPTDKSAPVAAPAPPTSASTQETAPTPSTDDAAQPEPTATDLDKPDNSPPLLPDNDTSQ